MDRDSERKVIQCRATLKHFHNSLEIFAWVWGECKLLCCASDVVFQNIFLLNFSQVNR